MSHVGPLIEAGVLISIGQCQKQTYLAEVILIENAHRFAVRPRVEPVGIATMSGIREPQAFPFRLRVEPSRQLLGSNSPFGWESTSRVAWVRAHVIHVSAGPARVTQAHGISWLLVQVLLLNSQHVTTSRGVLWQWKTWILASPGWIVVFNWKKKLDALNSCCG